MTFEVILYLMKNLRLHDVSIHRNFYQNRFINEYARKKKKLKSRSFLVRYRRTYVLKKVIKFVEWKIKYKKKEFKYHLNSFEFKFLEI